MMKELYERIQLAVTEFQTEDVIITSDPTPSDEPPTVPYQVPIM